MLESLKNEALTFGELSAEEKASRGILGRLTGPIASFKKATRNGRLYTEDLWEKAFASPIVSEMFANGGLVGQLEHPEGTVETDPMKIAVIMKDPPKKDENGHLIASVDILDTPCGQIAYALSKAGFKFGISSRGEGDVETDFNGNEVVDPDTYELSTFDIVALPACEDARLVFTESVDKPKFDYKTYLTESLEKADDEHKKAMKETLSQLGRKYSDFRSGKMTEAEDLRYTESIVREPETGSEFDTLKDDDIEVLNEEPVENTLDESDEDISNEVIEADDNNVVLANELHEALQRNAQLENTILQLNEKLSVCYTKELKMSEQLNSMVADVKRANTAAMQLTESGNKVKALQQRNKSLNEALKKESNKVNQMQESIQTLKKTYANEMKTLNETVETLKKDSKQKEDNLKIKLEESKKLAEKYKKAATKAIDKYMDSEAGRLGVNVETLKQKLPESYSFNDIDKAIADIQDYTLIASRLPVSMSPVLTENVQVKAKASSVQNDSLLGLTQNLDDSIDDDLLALARLAND